MDGAYGLSFVFGLGVLMYVSFIQSFFRRKDFDATMSHEELHASHATR
jgi:hypothetical protein